MTQTKTEDADGVVPGSFRDPDGQVLRVGERIFRTMSPAALSRMERLHEIGLLDALISEGLLVPSQLVPTSKTGLEAKRVGPTVIEHERIETSVYPYEFSFAMLRDGALLTLDVMDRCLAHGFILKDATSFNVQLHRGRMVFIDILSIDDLGDGEPWYAYAQFCREFLFPLMLTAYKGIPFQPHMRGAHPGVPPAEMAAIMNWRDNFRRGVFRHAKLQARFERSFKDHDVELKSGFKDAQLSRKMIEALISNLRKVIASMPTQIDATHWSDYADSNSYSAEEESNKENYVRAALTALKPRAVVDIGANTGKYSEIAATICERVFALDADAGCVDRIYQRVAAGAASDKIVPIVLDITDPSPALGWRLTERPSVFQRLRPDTFLALALMHHIRITGNIPFEDFFRFLAGWCPRGVVEWVDKDDPMVRRMLRNRVDVYDDYTWDNFRAALSRHFKLKKTENIGKTRRLCTIDRKT